MRVTSEFWVSAYLRTRNAKNKPSVLMHRGAVEAGAIYVRIDRLDGTYDLYQPASQFAYDDESIKKGDRLFTKTLDGVTVFDVMDRMESELKFDSDCWIVETECAEGSHDLPLANEDMF
ncbi:hypothetical protein SAMN04515647_3052 [Cohaesibacter sp. ES.047]|uniref:DUF1491 family protein n=1 Tax=Cohaesibacter sp. ES.047 TaxID=1798205 RepID=UPI000BB6CAA0|nr:DUF1491 family protein [Cohaesibacter sp. ES.047]SNY92784.1 hypothetical protein SAMN04515647_3052 [Cohaesibacter sp. ES.047]